MIIFVREKVSKNSDILNYLSENKQRLLREYNLTTIGLFGSLARGDYSENSDIDLLVEFLPNTDNLYEIKSRLKKEIKAVFDRDVDICRLKYLNPFFKKEILSDVKYV